MTPEQKARLWRAVEQMDPTYAWDSDIRAALARIDELEKEESRLHVILNRISGALVDAATVTLGDERTYEQSIRELTRQRDAMKAAVDAARNFHKAYKADESGSGARLATFNALTKALAALNATSSASQAPTTG